MNVNALLQPEAVAQPCCNFCILGMTTLRDPLDGREKLVLANFAAHATGDIIRTMMGDREFWVASSVRLQNRFVRWLDIRFPEYTSVFKHWHCKRSMAKLKELVSPQDLASKSVEEVITAWRKHMQRVGGSTEFLPNKGSDPPAKRNRSPHLGNV